ncbi:MAG: hypothetical protein ACYTEI_11065 [Planctomycetota bacterium]|jgi:hypothetical protein
MTAEKKDKQYGLEPKEPDPEPASEAAPKAPKPPNIEEPPAVAALDVCPNCGSPLGGVDIIVCMRCGFDMKALKVIETDTKATVAAKSDEEEQPVLSEPGTGDYWLPWAMTGAGLGLLAIGYLWGAGGLFGGEEAVGFGAKAVGLLKMLVKTAVLALAGFGGLYALTHMLKAQLGDAKLAAVRMLGIMAAIGLLAFFNLQSAAAEWTIESVTQALAYLGLTMVLFRLSARDAATLLGVTIVVVVLLLLVSAAVQWAVVPSG